MKEIIACVTNHIFQRSVKCFEANFHEVFHADTEEACFQNIISSLCMISEAIVIVKVEHLSQGRWKV